jgi:hypothetical protein
MLRIIDARCSSARFSDPSPSGEGGFERSEKPGGVADDQLVFPHPVGFADHPPQPKSDLFDFGKYRIPNSGKPEFGGEG